MRATEFQEGQKFDLGSKLFTEQEIIEFAQNYDPLDFHINLEAAANSIFGGLVTSGPQPFNWFYKNKWVPLFKDTVLAGLELNHWKLLKPVYVNSLVFCKAEILSVIENTERKHCTVLWKFVLTNEKEILVQTLEMTVLHKL